MDLRGRRWISPREAGLYLGFHVQHVYELLYAKEIPGARVGRAWRVDREALDRQLERQSGGGKMKSTGLRGHGGSRAPRLSLGPRSAGSSGETSGADG